MRFWHRPHFHQERRSSNSNSIGLKVMIMTTILTDSHLSLQGRGFGHGKTAIDKWLLDIKSLFMFSLGEFCPKSLNFDNHDFVIK